MAASARTSEGYRAALQEVAIGRMSHDEVAALLDGATLALERHRADLPENAVAIDYARNRLTALMKLLDRMRRSRPMRADPK